MLNLNDRDRCFVIAEAGTAHLGDRQKAMQLVDAAAYAGADAVKFQWFTPNVSKETMFCWIEGDEARVERWHKSAMSFAEWARVKDYAESLGLVFLASTFEHETVEWLNFLNVEATKVASRAAKTFPYEHAPKPWLISEGMGLPHCPPRGEKTYLQCEAIYPSKTAWCGLGNLGFSDHSGEPFHGIDAISRGCKLLEVHFMIDQLDAGPDLPACLTVDELKLVCEARDYYAESKVIEAQIWHPGWRKNL